MGTFEGHVIPSIIYSLLALWWGFVTAVKHVRTIRNKKNKFQASVVMPCFCCPTKRLRLFPIESCIKVTFLTIHAIVEILTGLQRTRDGTNRLTIGHENIHHVCMLSGFNLAAIVEVLMYLGLPLPKKADIIFNFFAFMIQALIMSVHLVGDLGLEYTVHMLWSIIIFATFGAYLIELYLENSYWPSMVRISFFFTQGTWMMQIAFVVWPKTTNPMFLWGADHGSMVWLTISLMYHFMGCFIVLMIEYLIVLRFINCLDRQYTRYERDIEEISSRTPKRIDFGDSKEYAMLIDANDENENEI